MYLQWAKAFVVNPVFRYGEVPIVELESSSRTMVSPYRAVVIRTFQQHKAVEHGSGNPTVEAIRKMVERDEGVAFLPRMCVEEELSHGLLREVRVKEMEVERNIRLVYPARRALSHAAGAFLELMGG